MSIRITEIISTNIKQLTVTLLIVTLISYAMLYRGIGDPFSSRVDSFEYTDLGQSAVLEHQHGLDKPFAVQYLMWVKNILRGDWGSSYVDGQSVLRIIGERIAPTLLLTGPAYVLGLLIAVVCGIMLAIYRYTLLDYVVHGMLCVLWSTPVFLLSILLLQIFSMHLNWLPGGGMSRIGHDFSIGDSWRYMIMPVGVLAIYYAASLIGIIRSRMISVLNEDYITTAYACGIAKRRVIFVYALKNAMLPLITAAAMSIPRFFSGAFVVEFVFAWPGMGRLIIDSAFKRDYPVLLAEVVLISMVVIVSNMASDVLYSLADPRIRLHGGNEE